MIRNDISLEAVGDAARRLVAMAGGSDESDRLARLQYMRNIIDAEIHVHERNSPDSAGLMTEEWLGKVCRLICASFILVEPDQSSPSWRVVVTPDGKSDATIWSKPCDKREDALDLAEEYKTTMAVTLARRLAGGTRRLNDAWRSEHGAAVERLMLLRACALSHAENKRQGNDALARADVQRMLDLLTLPPRERFEPDIVPPITES